MRRARENMSFRKTVAFTESEVRCLKQLAWEVVAIEIFVPRKIFLAIHTTTVYLEV